MRRNIGGHTHRNSRGSIYQQIGEAGGKHGRLLLRLVKVGNKVHGVFINIRQHLHRDLAEPGLRITHGGGSVSVHRTEISVAVHKGISGRPLLGHIYQRSVDGAVSMGMIFTHCITHDTGAFSVGFVRSIIQFYHGIQHSSLYRL